MGAERKIEALREATDRKRQEALDKTNAAIARLLKDGKRINFPTVAQEAGVSITYLYKYDELKDRINHLRKQQEASVKKPVTPQLASDKSKQVMLNQLRERVKQLEVDNQELRNKNEAVYGQLYKLQSNQRETEGLRAENTRLKIEIASLKEQVDKSSLQSLPPKVAAVPPVEPEDSKVASLDEKRTQQSGVSDKIKLELARLEVPLNTTLTKTIKSTSVEFVLRAIESLEEAMNNGVIERPGGWLNKAIKDGWKPNAVHLPQDEAERDVFKEWFDLARKQRLVLASAKGGDGQMIVYTVDGSSLPFKQMLAEHPLAKLKASL